MLAALAHGIRQVMVLITAEQPDNTERCTAAGVAQMVPLADAKAHRSARVSFLAVLAYPSCRLAAERMRDEMTALPGTDRVVAPAGRVFAGWLVQGRRVAGCAVVVGDGARWIWEHVATIFGSA